LRLLLYRRDVEDAEFTRRRSEVSARRDKVNLEEDGFYDFLSFVADGHVVIVISRSFEISSATT